MKKNLHSFDLLLKEKAAHLTKSGRKLLDYILTHNDESIFLNIEKLAEKVNVSEATVVRFCKALSFKGFPEFQRELRFSFRQKLTTTSRLQKTIGKATDEREILTKVLQTDVDNITETLKQLSVQEFRQFIKSIDSAERIVIIGLRSAYSLASFLGIYLELLQKNVCVLQPGTGNMWDQLLKLKKGDVVIGISFPRYTRTTVEAFQFAKSKGVRTLGITDSLISPIATHADHVLTARYKMNSFIESLTAAFSIINAIITGLGVYNKGRSMKSLKELEEIWKAQEVFYP